MLCTVPMCRGSDYCPLDLRAADWRSCTGWGGSAINVPENNLNLFSLIYVYEAPFVELLWYEKFWHSATTGFYVLLFFVCFVCHWKKEVIRLFLTCVLCFSEGSRLLNYMYFTFFISDINNHPGENKYIKIIIWHKMYFQPSWESDAFLPNLPFYFYFFILKKNLLLQKLCKSSVIQDQHVVCTQVVCLLKVLQKHQKNVLPVQHKGGFNSNGHPFRFNSLLLRV